MRKTILFFVLLISTAAFAQPSIVFESATHDFGPVEEGLTLEHSFPFENAGKDELVIEKVEAS